MTYAEEVVNTVHVVPLVGATVPLDAAALAAELNAVYRPAVARWRVTVDAPLTVADFDGELSDVPRAMLSNYTPRC